MTVGKELFYKNILSIKEFIKENIQCYSVKYNTVKFIWSKDKVLTTLCVWYALESLEFTLKFNIHIQQMIIKIQKSFEIL